MQLNPAIIRHPSMLEKPPSPGARSTSGSPQASAEIHAYIAARDLALTEAERETSHLTLNRAFLANQLVENCLKPARPPYQAQFLPETEAVRERQRCGSVGLRLSQLRAAARFTSSVAA